MHRWKFEFRSLRKAKVLHWCEPESIRLEGVQLLCRFRSISCVYEDSSQLESSGSDTDTN
jgi:hypothetical protein